MTYAWPASNDRSEAASWPSETPLRWRALRTRARAKPSDLPDYYKFRNGVQIQLHFGRQTGSPQDRIASGRPAFASPLVANLPYGFSGRRGHGPKLLACGVIVSRQKDVPPG